MPYLVLANDGRTFTANASALKGDLQDVAEINDSVSEASSSSQNPSSTEILPARSPDPPGSDYSSGGPASGRVSVASSRRSRPKHNKTKRPPPLLHVTVLNDDFDGRGPNRKQLCASIISRYRDPVEKEETARTLEKVATKRPSPHTDINYYAARSGLCSMKYEEFTARAQTKSCLSTTASTPPKVFARP
jgi:hypothetical protein